MIYAATKAIEATLKAKDVKFTIDENDKLSIVRISVGADNLSYKISFASSDDDSDVAVRAVSIVRNVPDNKRAAVLEAINEANRRFRYFKFTLDEDGDVNAAFDIPVNTPMSSVGDIARELLIRSMDIFDKVYPNLMKAMWA